jgi:hypothetical protein
MIPSSSLCRPVQNCWSVCLRWISLGLAAAAVSSAFAAAPLAPFALTDLNANSPRLGSTISPSDYGEWISAYYFGNEG